MARFGFAIGLCLTFLGSGCNSGPAQPPPTPTAAVTGKLTVDGKPAPTGEVHICQPGVPPSVLKVTDGSFSGTAPVGANIVEVYIHKEGPPNPRYPETPTKINTVSPKFWGPKTTLKATVDAKKPTELKFDVTSQ